MKLPHWASILVAFAVVAVTWVVQQQTAGNLVLPAAVVTVLAIVQPLLTILSPSAVASVNLRAAVAKGTAALSTLAFVGVLVALTGCVGGVPTPQTQAVIDASAQLALCVETVYTADAGKSAEQIVLDEGVTCGPDAAILVTAIGQEVTSANKATVIAKIHARVAAAKGH